MSKKENNSVDWFDEINRCQEAIINISNGLDSYSYSLFHTGNEKLANALSHYSQRLNKIQERIEKATDNKINTDLRLSQEHSASVLKAALAGALVAKEKEG